MDKEQCHALSCFEKKSAPIDTTRKYDCFCNVAVNREFDHDDVIKMKNKCHISCRELSNLPHIKIWAKIDHGKVK